MTIFQILKHFQANPLRIHIYFLHTNSSLKSILGNPEPQFTKFELKSADALHSQLKEHNLESKNILGLVYKQLNPETNQLDLFFLNQIPEENSKQKYLKLSDIEANYTGSNLQISALYALGFLRCLRDKEELNWYPVE